MRKTILAANWKMHKSMNEARDYARAFLPLVIDETEVEIIICPAYTGLAALQAELPGHSVKLGAQNIFWEASGAYTGEISAAMLLDSGCDYVIIGHSERRHMMGESDTNINRKIKAALENSLTPIFCVGETLPERQNNMAREVVKEQIKKGLNEISLASADLVIAYEPVWAIGTGINASADDAQEMIEFIRAQLTALYGEQLAQSICILYGGSVKAENIADFMAKKDIDGALVGGASLNPNDFARIVRLGKDD